MKGRILQITNVCIALEVVPPVMLTPTCNVPSRSGNGEETPSSSGPPVADVDAVKYYYAFGIIKKFIYLRLNIHIIYQYYQIYQYLNEPNDMKLPAYHYHS